MSRRERLDLDWIRGAAALAVAALHAREIGWIGLREFAANQAGRDFVDLCLAYLFAPLVWGSVGVAVFFVLSGYVIHASAAEHLVHDRDWRLDAREFYVRRFARVYAVLIVALLVTIVLDSASRYFAPGHPNLRPMTPASLAGNLLALQGSVFQVFGSNGPLWTLAIEIHFYAMYPLLLIARRRLGAGTLLLASGVLSIGSFAVLNRSGIELFTSYYVCWILGFYAAELRARGARPVSRLALPTLAAAAAAVGCTVFFYSHYFALLAWSLAFFLYLLMVFERRPPRGLVVRAATVVGGFSYTLYAVHEPVVVFLVSWLNGGAKSDSMWVVLGYLAVTVGVSYLLYLPFERRSVEWLAARGTRRDPALVAGGETRAI